MYDIILVKDQIETLYDVAKDSKEADDLIREAFFVHDVDYVTMRLQHTTPLGVNFT